MTQLPSRARVLTLLAIGITASSSAALFIEIADMPALTLTAGRLIGVGVLYAIIGRDFISGFRSLDRRDRRKLLIAAPLLAIHFALWIGAFSFTDLPSAVLLLAVQPLAGVIAGAIVFRERVTPSIYLSMGLAFTGLIVITYDDIQLSMSHLIGDALAVSGSLIMIGFFAYGKRLRLKLSFPSYMTLTYGVGGLFAGAMVLATGTKLTGFPLVSWLCLLGLIFITTGIGHALINYALPYTRLFTVNLTVFAEPIIAIASAALVIGQKVTGGEIVGGAFLLSGLLVGINDERRLKAEVVHSGEEPRENGTAREPEETSLFPDTSPPSSLP